MNATGDEDRPAVNKVLNENRKAWNTGKRSLWEQLRAFFFGADVTEDDDEPEKEPEEEPEPTPKPTAEPTPEPEPEEEPEP